MLTRNQMPTAMKQASKKDAVMSRVMIQSGPISRGFTFLFGVLLAIVSNPSVAQDIPSITTAPIGPAPIGPAPIGQSPQVSAAVGSPYGVAVIEIPLANPVVDQALAPLEVDDPAKRIFFPYSEDIQVQVTPPSERPVPRPGRGRLLNRVGNLIREIARDDKTQVQTIARRITFLFTGDAPMSVVVSQSGRSIGNFDVIPQANPTLHSQSIANWWQGYTNAAKRQIDAADYPTWVENYLVAMLSGRMGLPLPTWYAVEDPNTDQILDTLKLIAGAEEIGESVFRRRAAGLDSHSLTASMPLPAPPRWAPYPLDAVPANGAWPANGALPANGAGPADDADTIEPIANKVPSECFYIRYGSFENYLWFRDLTEENGGDISRMISLRGVDTGNAKRMEEQLSVESTEMSRLFGPTVIADQAIIGRDLFLGDGASVGVLFQAKNAFLLRTSLNSDRSKRARGDDAVTLRDVKIAGQPATLLSTADNRIRSFMVESDDGFFLVTNSKTIARRFLEVDQANAAGSLGQSASFKLARRLMPLDRDDTLFAYFSPEMLRGLIAPEYLIELRRRLTAKSEIALVQLAELAANQEGVLARPGETMGIAGLKDAGFLPTTFGTRPDGSGTVEVGDRVMDTLRGARGTFLPIADVQFDQVSPDEHAWYSRIAAEYSNRFPAIDPIMVGVVRNPVDPVTGVETLSIHAEVAPFGIEKYGKWANQLGPPTRVALQFAPDDIFAVQAHVASQQLGPPTHLFAAIKDSMPPRPDDFDGILNIYRSVKSIPGYLGAWPQPGALDRLPLGLGRGQPVGPGMSRLIGGLYRYSDGSYSILSFWPDILENSLQFLNAIDVEDDAQIRVRAGSLAGSQIEGWVNEQLYARSKEGSVAGAKFLGILQRQLGVAPTEAQQAANQILGGELQCSLDGDYQYSSQTNQWTSTAWRATDAPAFPPPGYQSPVLTWFRGGEASLTQYEDRLIVNSTIRVQRKGAAQD